MRYAHKLAQILIVLFIVQIYAQNNDEFVTIAILAKDKAHTLPLYLACIEAQTWPKCNTHLYIRTNNNNDDTAQVLRDWIDTVGNEYAQIYFDDTNVDEPIEQFKQHEWNYTRFRILGAIRQNSVDWAYQNSSHYFVADCDNFICSNTIQAMVETKLPIVAPLLRCFTQKYYSNYHDTIDNNGYYAPSVFYYDILEQKVRGIIEVPVVHCTYFIRHEVLDTMCYDDESARYEYVIFSDSARKQQIPQYIDNRKIYLYISFAEKGEEFEKEQYDF